MEMTLSRLLREPLVQFLLIGAVLFGAYRTLQPAGSANLAPQQNQAAAAPVQSALQPSRQIVLTLDRSLGSRRCFEAQWGRDPTPKELDRLGQGRREGGNPLSRRARAGARQGRRDRHAAAWRRKCNSSPRTSRRRTADRRGAQEPGSIRTQKQFVEPARVSFRHLYFSPDRRGANARPTPRKALTRSQWAARRISTSPGADPFMFQDYYRDKTAEYLGKEFGPPFAAAVEKLPQAPGRDRSSRASAGTSFSSTR